MSLTFIIALKDMNRRSSLPNFKQSCKCIMHDIWTAGDDSINALNITNCKKIKMGVVQYLCGIKLLPPRANFICVECYSEGIKRMNGADIPVVSSSNKRKKETEQEEEQEDDVKQLLLKMIDGLESGDYHSLMDDKEPLWQRLLYLIGDKLCKEPIYKDGLQLQSKYKDSKFLINLDILTFVKERNQLLVRFLWVREMFES